MGTLLQEMGHDITLIYFIDLVLKKRAKELFYLVSPAVGPRIDIHFWNSRENEYTSAYNISKTNFIPEFYLRVNLDKEDIQRLNKESNYKRKTWYKELSQKLEKDLKAFVEDTYTYIGQFLKVGLPDIVGIDRKGKVSVLAEVKFEGFGKKATEEILQHFELANQLNVTYYLVIPKKPVYGRGTSVSWIRRNLPKRIKVYLFTIGSGAIIPKQADLEFIAVK